MESLLSGIPGVVVYIDDVLVMGKTQEEHLKALDEAPGKIREAGLRLRRHNTSTALNRTSARTHW